MFESFPAWAVAACEQVIDIPTGSDLPNAGSLDNMIAKPGMRPLGDRSRIIGFDNIVKFALPTTMIPFVPAPNCQHQTPAAVRR